MPTASSPRHAPRGFWRTFASVFVTCLLLGVIALAVLLQVVPRLMGGTSLTVLSGSMEPLFSPGDVIAVRSVQPSDIRVGDVVTFQPVSDDPALITHRVVGKGWNSVTGAVFTTQGDANTAADEPIKGAQIKGLYMYHVPYVGYILQLAGTHGSVFLTVAGVLLVGFAIYTLVRPRRRARPSPNTHTTPLAVALLATALATAALMPSGAAHAEELDVPFAGPTMHVDWRGDVQATVESSFFGARTVTPGDRVARQVRISNMGPTAGTVTVRLVDVVRSGTGDLGPRLDLAWAVSDGSGIGTLQRATDGSSTVAEGIRLRSGESRLFTLVLSYPAVATEGARADAGRSTLHFDVQFLIRESTESPVPPTLPATGGVIAISTVIAGVALLSLGIALVRVRRRGGTSSA